MPPSETSDDMNLAEPGQALDLLEQTLAEASSCAERRETFDLSDFGERVHDLCKTIDRLERPAARTLLDRLRHLIEALNSLEQLMRRQPPAGAPAGTAANEPRRAHEAYNAAIRLK